MEIATQKNAQEFLRNAAGVASYYGFSPISTIAETDTPERKSAGAKLSSVLTADDHASAELLHAATLCIERARQKEKPVLVYHFTLVPLRNSRMQTLRFSLSVFGVKKSIAEALVMKTAIAIFEENGVTDTHVRVNSMGDRDSSLRFLREAGNYLKKNAGDIPLQSREALKTDVFRACYHLKKKNHPIWEDTPKPMEFLSDKSRRHLSEVVEYLETTDMSYEIDTSLIGHHAYYSDTIFEIRNNETGETLCRGGRCDELTRAFGGTQTPLVGTTLLYTFKGARTPAQPRIRMRKPKVYLIQLGFEARLRSFAVIEALRKANIPLSFSLGTDGLREQLDEALALGIPYVAIVGQREALDGTALVRNLETQAQTAVPFALLTDHLKAL